MSVLIISILQLGSAYSLYSGYHSYKILSDFKKENDDNPTSLPVDEKYFNSMFIFSCLMLHSLNHVQSQLNGQLCTALMVDTGDIGGIPIYWLYYMEFEVPGSSK